MYEAWLTRAGAIFGEPLPHAPAPTLPGAPETTDNDAPATQTTAPAAAGASDAADANLTAVSAPEIPDIPDPPAAADGAEPAAEEPARPAREGAIPRALPDEAHVSDAVRQMIAAAHATGATAKTLNRLAVLLAARKPDTVLKLEDLDDKLAAELARRVVQAHNVGWDNDTLADMVEKALRSERHRTAAQRRKAYGDHRDRLATEAQAHAEQAAPEAA